MNSLSRPGWKDKLLRWLVLVLIGALFLNGPQVQAAPTSTIIVTNTNNSGAGSLRQAVTDAISGGHNRI